VMLPSFAALQTRYPSRTDRDVNTPCTISMSWFRAWTQLKFEDKKSLVYLVQMDRASLLISVQMCMQLQKTPWPESARKLYRPNDRRFSAKLLQIFADRGCHVVSVKDP
jgi:hypothetical protein